MDLTPVITPLVGVASLVLSGVATLALSRTRTWLGAHTSIAITDQQWAAVNAAAQVGAGMVSTELAKGALGLADVHVANPTVVAAADLAIGVAQRETAALGLTQAQVAGLVVGELGKLLSADPTVPSVPANTVQPAPIANSAAAATSAMKEASHA